MAEKRKYLTPQDLLNYIKAMPLPQLQGMAASVREAQRLAQTAYCEEFFNRMESLLSSHDGSKQEAHQLLTRLRAGRPNLPLEDC